MRQKIAIIGGTGLCSWPGVQLVKARKITTPYGSPSAEVQVLEYQGNEFIFLPRHGGAHSIPPHKINYRANIAALHAMGVRDIYAVNAVGGIGPDFAAEVIAVPDQLNDYSWGREHTFFDGDNDSVEHVDFSYPYTEALRRQLIAAAESCNIAVQPRGCYAVTHGPRLETVAEVRRLARDGNDLIGMTGMPEAALARELGINYASICLVVNPAAGECDGLITMEEIAAVIDSGMVRVRTILAAAVAAWQAERDS